MNGRAPTKCLVCHTVWVPSTYNIRQGSGCPSCVGNTISKSLIAKAAGTFDKKLLEKTSKIHRVGEYLGSKQPLKLKCHCGNVFHKTPSKILADPRCPQCQKKHKTYSEDVRGRFLEECAKRGFSVSSYSGTGHRATICCKHGHKWETFPWVIESGSGCPTCAVVRSYTYRKVKIRGRVFHVQGFEDIAIHYMLSVKKVSVRQISFGKANVPTFRYVDAGGSYRNYFPDFQVGSRIVEVKSTWTAGLTEEASWFDSLKRKAASVVSQGYRFTLLLIKLENTKVLKASLPNNWQTMSRESVLRSIRWVDITKHIEKACLNRTCK